MAVPGRGGSAGAVARDDVDDARVVDQVDVMGAGIRDSDAIGPKRDGAGIGEERG